MTSDGDKNSPMGEVPILRMFQTVFRSGTKSRLRIHSFRSLSITPAQIAAESPSEITVANAAPNIPQGITIVSSASSSTFAIIETLSAHMAATVFPRLRSNGVRPELIT